MEVVLEPAWFPVSTTEQFKTHLDFINHEGSAKLLTTPCVGLYEGLHVGLGGTGWNLTLIINKARLPQQTWISWPIRLSQPSSARVNWLDREAGWARVQVGQPSVYKVWFEGLRKDPPWPEMSSHWLIKDVCNFTVSESFLCVYHGHSPCCPSEMQVALGYRPYILNLPPLNSTVNLLGKPPPQFHFFSF